MDQFFRSLLGQGSSGPDSVPNLWQWVKADAGVFQDSGLTTPATADNDPVGGWQDQSGNNRHWTQATSGNRPTFLTADINGKPAIRGDDTDNYLIGPNLSSLDSAGAGEVFIVVKADTDPCGASYERSGLWSLGSDITSNHYPDPSGIIMEGWGRSARAELGNPTPSLASWRLYNVASQSGEYTARLDGTQIFTTGTSTPGWHTAERTLPFLFRTDAAFYFGGNIAEMITYSAVLSSGNRDIVESYIASKYGLTIA